MSQSLIRKIPVVLLIILFLFIIGGSSLALAQVSQPTPTAEPTGGLVPCGRGAGPEDCGFDDLIQLVQNILNFSVWVATLLAAILIIYAGGKMIYYASFMSNPGQAAAAKKILINVVIGYIIVLVAYLVVKEFIDFFAREEGPLREALIQVFGNG